MDYITGKERKKLSNEPYEISVCDIQYIMRQNEQDKLECRHVTESSYRGETYYQNDGHPGNEKIPDFTMAFFKEFLYRDMKTDGFVLQYPHGTIISQGRRNSYFRGEKQIYTRSVPSLLRQLQGMDEDKQTAYRFINRMRIEEFRLFLCRFEITRLWMNNYGTVLFEPLAQHYGFETEWLDITSDFDVALFFATCKWDRQRKRWIPLTREDTEKDDDTKYGVIFHVPGWQVETRMAFGEESDAKNRILPIGYQPFMRCHSQHAYAIHMKEASPLQDDIIFEKLHFRHDEDLSKRIYEKMDCGRKIYPQEGLDEFDDIIETIKNMTTFSSEAYHTVLDTEACYSSDEEARKALKGINIIDESPVKLSRQRIRRFNRLYEDFSVEKHYGIRLLSRNAKNKK